MSHSVFELVSPRAAALRILATRYAAHASHATSHSYSLAVFQQEAVARARTIMQTRNGVILADSVGLGKTFVAAALIEIALEAQQHCVVAVPGSMRAVWMRELRPLSERHDAKKITLVTHGQLSRGHVLNPNGLVVVDEAHVFRSPHTRRYRALRRSCVGCQVLLLTATPINNALADLYFQLRLFAADNAFRDIGIGSLATLLRSADTDSETLSRLRRAVVIRRTRSELRVRFQHIELPTGRHLKFPRYVNLQNVLYAASIPTDDIGSCLTRIRFVPYANEVTPVLLRLSLLKRLQSSRHALAMSLDRLIVFYDRYLTALGSGRVLKPRLLHDVAGEQLLLTELLVEECSSQIPLHDLWQRAAEDLAALRELRERVGAAPDHKFTRLLELLRARRNAKTLVFTEFVDTAEFLWRGLQSEFRVALVTGNAAFLGANPCTRGEVIQRFAPRSNAAMEPPAHEAVDVLIATDVLAEGLNLQDADAVVSYDLPWNPVKLIQRAGRVDRIGSLHDVVNVYNFMPDREFDVWLGLVRTLRSKLIEMRKTVGQESDVLEYGELDLDFMAALAAGRADLQEEAHDWQFREVLPDLDEAAREGSVAAFPGARQRTLVCWSRGHESRELVVTHDGVSSDRSSADDIIARSLGQRGVAAFTQHHCIDRARTYIEQEHAFATDRVNILAREIRNAVRRIGLLATSEVLMEADRTLAMLPSYFGNPRGDIARLRGSDTLEKLVDALTEIRGSCTPESGQEAPELRLIAAISVI